MKELFEDIDRWQARGERVAIATVVATRRSAPRPVGSKLAVSESGELAGSVSGGCVESDVYQRAREVMASGRPQFVTYGIADAQAWDVGLPCGGEIDVLRAAVFTLVEGEPLGRKLLVVEDGEQLGDGPEELAALAPELIREATNQIVEAEGGRWFCEIVAPPPRLVVIGAVDTAEALCVSAKLLGWRTIVADARSRFATRDRIPSADELVVAWPEDALARIQPDHATAVVILTHDEKFDVPALKGALATEAFYIGALGSRRSQAERRERLREAGVEDAALERIQGPCGLDIGAESQAETALSILAEILAIRGGREGGPLKAARGRIHAQADEAAAPA